MAKITKTAVAKAPAKKASKKPELKAVEPVVAAVAATPAPAPVPAPVVKAAVKPAAKPAASPRKVSQEERHQMIAEASYFIALRNGFNSDPAQNWGEAEAQIDAKLKADGRL